MSRVLKVWGLSVIWVAALEEDAELTATAEAVQQVTVVHVHRHLHLTHGGDAAALGLALPPGSVTTTTEEE